MKSVLLSAPAVALLATAVWAEPQEGPTLESVEIESAVLGRTVRYSVFLPPGYAASAQSYPVLYLLHGAGGNETSWVEEGGVDRTANAMTETGTLPPMILVMPDGGSFRYLNSYDGSVRWEDFFFDEFMPDIESRYRVQPGQENRAILGSSMGGFGALLYALRHPHTFRTAVSFSGSFCEDDRVLSMTTAEWNESTRGPAYGMDLEGEERFTDHYRAWDPCDIVETMDPAALAGTRLYLDCGDDDFRNDGNARLHILMRSLGIAHEYRVRNGGHGWAYYRSALEDGLRFIGEGFSTRH